MEDRVKSPALALIIVAAIGLVFVVISLIMNLVGGGAGQAVPIADPEMRAMMESLQGGGSIVGAIISFLIGAAANGLVLFAGLKMKNLESYGISMAGAIVAIIPCLSPCCIVGIPFGIWALVVLLNDEVKTAFKS